MRPEKISIVPSNADFPVIKKPNPPLAMIPYPNAFPSMSTPLQYLILYGTLKNYENTNFILTFFLISLLQRNKPC